jgi:hypothetical protein
MRSETAMEARFHDQAPFLNAERRDSPVVGCGQAFDKQQACTASLASAAAGSIGGART